MNYENLSDRELDALIRQKLFNNKPPPACYSTHIGAAFEVVEAMRERGYAYTGGHHQCESLPRAICIAALRATDA